MAFDPSNPDPNAPEYSAWYNSLPASTRAYQPAPGSTAANYRYQDQQDHPDQYFTGQTLPQYGNAGFTAGHISNLSTNGGLNGQPAPSLSGPGLTLPNGNLRNNPQPGFDPGYRLLSTGGTPSNPGSGNGNTKVATTPINYNTTPGTGNNVLGVFPGSDPTTFNNNNTPTGLSSLFNRTGVINGSTSGFRAPTPGMGMPSLNNAAKTVGSAMGTSGMPGLQNPFARYPGSGVNQNQPVPGGPGSNIPAGQGLNNTAANPAPKDGTSQTPPPAGTNNQTFVPNYQDYLRSHSGQLTGGSEGGQGTFTGIPEDQWNSMTDAQKWQNIGDVAFMDPSDPRYAQYSQGLGITDTQGPNSLLGIGHGTPAPGSFNDPSAVQNNNGNYTFAHQNLTPGAEQQGGGLSDRFWAWAPAMVASLGAFTAAGLLPAADGASIPGASASLETGGYGTGVGVAGSGLPGAATAAVPGAGVTPGTPSPEGTPPPSGTPGQPGLGPNGEWTPPPEMDPVHAGELNPLGPSASHLGSAGLLDAVKGNPYLNNFLTRGVAGSLAGRAINGALNTNGSTTNGGSSGTPGGSSGSPGNGNNSGTPDWLNAILQGAGLYLGNQQQQQNINQYQQMSTGIADKGDIGSGIRPDLMNELALSFSDPSKLLQDPAYANMRQQNLDNLSRTYAARGLNLSGNEMGGLEKYGENLDYNQIQNTRSQLMQAANLGDPSGMAKAQLLTLPYLFDMKNNSDASTNAGIMGLIGQLFGGKGNNSGNLGSLISQWLNGGNNGNSGNSGNTGDNGDNTDDPGTSPTGADPGPPNDNNGGYVDDPGMTNPPLGNIPGGGYTDDPGFWTDYQGWF